MWKVTIFNTLKLIIGVPLIIITFFIFDFLFEIESKGSSNPDYGPFRDANILGALLMICIVLAFYAYWLLKTIKLIFKYNSRYFTLVNILIILLPYLYYGFFVINKYIDHSNEIKRGIEYKELVISQIKDIDMMPHQVVDSEFDDIIHYYLKDDTLFYAVRYYDNYIDENNKKIFHVSNGVTFNLRTGSIKLFSFTNGESHILSNNNSYGIVDSSSNPEFLYINLKNNDGISEAIFNNTLNESNLYGCELYRDMFIYNIVDSNTKQQLPNAPPKIQKDQNGILYAPVSLKNYDRHNSESQIPFELIRNNYYIVRIGNGQGDLFKIPKRNDLEETLLGISKGNDLYAITTKRIIQLHIKE